MKNALCKKEEIKVLKNYTRTLNKWADTYEVDSIERNWILRLSFHIEDIIKEVDWICGNRKVSMRHALDLFTNVKELHRLTNKRKYDASYKAWDIVHCMYLEV